MSIEDIKLIFREDRIPAAYVDGYAVSPHQGLFAAAWDRPEFSSSESTRRLVACWNACRGIETETLQKHWPEGGLLPCVEVHEKAEAFDQLQDLVMGVASDDKAGPADAPQSDLDMVKEALRQSGRVKHRPASLDFSANGFWAVWNYSDDAAHHVASGNGAKSLITWAKQTIGVA